GFAAPKTLERASRVLQGVGVLALAVPAKRGIGVDEARHETLRNRLRDARGRSRLAERGERLVPLHGYVSRDVARRFKDVTTSGGLLLGRRLQRFGLGRLLGRQSRLVDLRVPRSEVAGLVRGHRSPEAPRGCRRGGWVAFFQ